MKPSVARLSVLVLASILGMAMLGVIAFAFAVTPSAPWAVHEEWGLLGYPVSVGAFLGFFSAPFVVAFLRDTDLRRSLPLVYGISAGAAAMWACFVPVGFGISAAFPAYFSVVVSSRWCATRFAMRSQEGRCEHCDYDLTGCIDPGCPECGWRREGDTS